MSYQNPLIIQNNPGGNIGVAANKAATSIQDAILFNMEKQEKKQEEIAKKQAIDDANAIAAAKESSTEAAAERKAFNANEYSSIGIGAWERASEDKFKYNQIVANVNATREERLAAQNAINSENTFQQNQVGALAYLSEDRQEYMELKTKGNVYSTGGLNGAYVKFLEGDPNVKLTGKRVGNDWVNTLTYDGKSYELPTDKIKDGSFEAFALTPDLYEGVDNQAKEINAARNKREEGMREFTDNDLSGITEAVNVNIQKATANFDSYLKMDPMKAKAVLANSVYPELSEADIKKKMKELQAGGLKGATAQIEVREEMKRDIEYKWGMNTGVFRNDKNEFEVMKPEELVNTKSSGGKENEKDIADRTFKSMINREVINNSLVDDKESFVEAFKHSLPYPNAIGKTPVVETIETDGGFEIVLDAKSATGGEPTGEAVETGDVNTINLENFKDQGPSEVKRKFKFDYSNPGHMKTYLEITGYTKGMRPSAILAQAKALALKYKNSK